MFGHNAITGQKFFRDAPEARAGELLVTSIFKTLQGEGPFAGVPAVFVRLAYCQLQCSFCDTYFDSGDWFGYEALADRIESLREEGTGEYPGLLVVTGGEPTLQANLRGFLDLAMLSSMFRRTQIETNGLLVPNVPQLTTVVMSPKCSEKNGRPRDYLRPPAASLARADCLKFVLSAGDRDSPYFIVPAWALEWGASTGREIFVSPMAEYNCPPSATYEMYQARKAPDLAQRTKAERVSFWEPGLLDMKKCQRNYEYAAEYAVHHGLRLTVQMHLFASLS